MSRKRYIWGLFPLLSLCLCVTGCREQADLEAEGGRFEITIQEKYTSPQTRIRPYEVTDELKRQFTLDITDEGGRTCFEGTMESYASATPALKPATYLLTASFGANKPLALDEPYYLAEQTAAAIQAGRVTPVTLECTVGNAMATFAFADPDQAGELLQDYTIESRVGSESVSCMVDDGRNPYFREGANVDFYLNGTTSDGKTVNYKFASIAGARKQMNYKYTLHIGGATEGSAILGITVSTVVESVSLSETIPQEWLPKAKLSAVGFDENGTMDYCETEDASAKVNFTALRPVEEVEFTLALKDQNLASLNKTYLLSELTDEDRQRLTAAGIVLPELGTTSGALDLSPMVSALLCANDGGTVANSITMRVKANHRWSDSKTYTVNVRRPEFSITVDERDSWSKEFAVHDLQVAQGNADRLKAGMTYQYSTDDGTTWHDCNSGMKQKFISHPEQKAYKVRAIYRSTLVSNVEDVTLETPTQLPNSDMEEWTDENYSQSFYCFYPWKGDKGNCHWDTNNTWTTRHRWNSSNAVRKEYNGFHAVSYVPGRSGLAAEIRNTANGRGNTVTIRWEWGHSELTINKVAGMLFLGEANCQKKGDDVNGKDEFSIKKNANFNSRPTALNFYYKYKPLDGDACKVYVELLDKDQKVISSNSYSNTKEVTDWGSPVMLELPYNESNLYEKACYIYVEFDSTDKPGDGMKYNAGPYKYYINQGKDEKTHSQALVGSILTIDDISLVYDK